MTDNAHMHRQQVVWLHIGGVFSPHLQGRQGYNVYMSLVHRISFKSWFEVRLEVV